MAARQLHGETDTPAPGLLPWHIHLLAAIAGMLALREGWPMAAAAAGCLGAAWYLGRRPNVVLFTACFALGLAYSWLRMPATPACPDWAARGDKVIIAGTISQVVGREGHRVQAILTDLKRLQDYPQPGGIRAPASMAPDAVEPPAPAPAADTEDTAAMEPAPEAAAATHAVTEHLPGQLIWTWQNPKAWPIEGQKAVLRASVKPVHGFANPGAWDTAFHWARQGVFYRAWTRGASGTEVTEQGNTLDRWRATVRSHILTGLADGGAPGGTNARPSLTQGQALLAALLVGDRSGLSQATVERMTEASLAHTLSISGSHLAMVAAFGWGLASLAGIAWPGLWLRIPRPRLAVLLAAPLVAAYWWLGGGGAALNRSVLMFCSFGALLLLGKSHVMLDGLFLAIALILTADPLAAYDIGLQLSALAVAGIGLFAGPVLHVLLRWFRLSHPTAAAEPRQPSGWAQSLMSVAREAPHALAGALAVSIAANMLVQPLVCRHFGQFSPNILWNLIWLPVMGAAVLPLGFLGLVLGLIPGFEDIASHALRLGAMPLDWLIDLLNAAVPYGLASSLTTARPGPLELAGWLLFTVSLAIWSHLPPRRRTVLAGICLLLLAGPTLWRDIRSSASNGGVSLLLMDVGQGQAGLITISAPGGDRRYLVDGGGGGPDFDIGQAVIAKVLTDGLPPRLDGVFLSHPEADHLSGLSFLLRTFAVGFLAIGPDGEATKAGRKLLELAKQRGIPIVVLKSPDAVPLAPGVTLTALHPGGDAPAKRNDQCLALRLTWNGRGLAILPGDLEARGVNAMLETPSELTADVLILPHHGSNGSLSAPLYDRVSPQLALASAGYLNRYGFPGAKVRAALSRRGTPLLATSECGALRVSWTDPQTKTLPVTMLDCPASMAPLAHSGQ